MLHTYNTDTHFDPNIVVTCNAQDIALTMPIRKPYSGCDKLRTSVKGYFMNIRLWNTNENYSVVYTSVTPIISCYLATCC